MIAVAQVRISDSKPGIFLAGASTSNITPSLGKGIVGNFGKPPPAVHVHDELHSRALVLDDGSSQLVWVIVDNVAIKREVFDEAKRQVQQKTGIPVSNMMMAATHTHSCIGAGGGEEGDELGWCTWNEQKPLVGYQNFLVERIVDGVIIAHNNLEPAKIGWGSGQVPQHVFNRRWKMKEKVINPFGKLDQVRMNPGFENPNLLAPAGPTDAEIAFISVQSKMGRPIALMGNYSLHYVGGVPKGHLSADYFGVFADRIQELLGADRQDPPFVGMMSNGTSGDVNNLNFGAPAENHPPYEKMRLVADDLAQEVLRVYPLIKHHDWVKLQAAQKEISLEVRRATPEMLKNSNELLEGTRTNKPSKHPLEMVFAESLLQMEEEWPDRVDIILQAFRIGDLGVAGIPYEVFAETGLEIKSKSNIQPVFTISLANGWGGYLPTPEQHNWGGYETWLTVNKVEISASQKIVQELLALFYSLE
ncbi:MAG: neutral/alkaline non-lysosomal ceramidase N-terminal domain-containing protein [Cyclobacteriaceae bacterium]